MFNKMVRYIVKTGKAHRWLKPIALIVLIVLSGSVALTEWTVKQSVRAWRAARRTRAVLARCRDIRRERMERQQKWSRSGSFRPSHGPASRAIAVVLSVCMVFTLIPSSAFAAEAETGLCEHHPAHTGECGYQEAKPGHPCEHQHTEDCYTGDLICGYIVDEDAAASDSDAEHIHNQDCYALECPHDRGEHPDDCGYKEDEPGTPCGYVCELCGSPVDSGNPGNEIETITLVAFDGLDETVVYQSVPAGTPLEELVLPVTLQAAAQAGDENPKPVVIDGVTWAPDVPYESIAGSSYSFTASAAGYICAGGVDWPTVTVTVEEPETEPESDGVAALSAAIDALPDVDSLYAAAPGDADPEFPAWAAEIRSILAGVESLWADFQALPESAWEAVGASRIAKLEALFSLFQRLGEVETLNLPTHSHCICGGSVNAGDHTSHTSIDWTEWTDTASMPDTEGNYCLTGDVTLSNAWEVPDGTTGLCLNGYTLAHGSASSEVILVKNGATLNICDCRPDSSNSASITDPIGGNPLTITGGLITGGEIDSLAGGGVNCKGNLNLYGGTIAGNASMTTGSGGGGVLVYAGGIFHMYGGAIRANRANAGGGGVYVYTESILDNPPLERGQLYLHGGQITGNKASSFGGGVFNEGVFHMDGGAVTGNTAGMRGGGLYATSFILSGGRIADNHAGTGMGGVYMDGYESGGFVLQGSPVITDNTAGDSNTLSNLWFQNGQTVTVGGGGLTAGAKIGVSSAQMVPQLFPVKFTGNNGADYSACFFSDDQSRIIQKGENNALQLALLPTPTATGGKLIYAKGAPLLLAAGSPDETKTVIYIDRDYSGSLTDGDTIFNPNVGTETDGTVAGNDLSLYCILGGGLPFGTVTGDTRITMIGGRVSGIYGGGDGTVTGSTSITVKGGTVGYLYGGGGYSTGTVTGNTNVTVEGGQVNYLYGGGEENAMVGGSRTVTVGSGVKVGSAQDLDSGVIINGGTGDAAETDGVTSFVIRPALTGEEGSIRVVLPGGFDASGSPDLAAGAVQGDLAKIKLAGDGAAGKEAYFENNAIKVRAKSADAALSALTYTVDGGQETNMPDFAADTTDYDVTLPYGTSQNAVIALTGTVNNNGASITENNGVTLSDGTGTATVKVTAEDETTVKIYTVSFTIAADARSDAKQITAFTIRDQVGDTVIDQNSHTITVTMPKGTDVTNLTPAITVSEKAGVSPQSGAAQNFTNSVTYTVTAENETTQDYTVTVNVQTPVVTGVIVTPVEVNVQKGSTQQFNAAVAGENSPTQTVTWSIEGNHADGTTITESGLLAVDSNENQSTLTVKATSTADTSKSGTATVTVTTQAVTRYTLTVMGGSGSGDYAEGASVTIFADSRDGHSFSGWTVVSGSISLADPYQSTTTFSMPAENITIQANWSRNSSGGDGGDSSDGDSTPPAAAAPPETKPDASVTAQTEIKAQGDGKGGAEVTVSESAVDSAIRKAAEEARRSGTQDKGITIRVNMADNSRNVDSLTVNLPKVIQERIIENKVQTFALALERPDITLSLSLESVREINRQANADVQLTATRLTDTSSLSDEAKAVVGSRPVFRFTATYEGGAKTVTDFGGGSVTVMIPYKLQPDESAGGLCLVYIDEQGKPQFLTNSSYSREEEVLRGATNHFSLYAVGYKAPGAFGDVAAHWAREDIEFVAVRGLMEGVGDGKFDPDGTMTRAMFAAALGRLAGINTGSYTAGAFTDVPADACYAPYAAWAQQAGVVKEIGGGLFGPDRKVSRQEMAVIMANYVKAMGCKVSVNREAMTFADNADIASWAAEAVRTMQQAGVLMGKDDNRFDPLGNVSRAQAAAILHRYVELMIDRQTAQGLDINDSGSAMLYENGKLVRSASCTVGAFAYSFNSFGEAVLPTKKQGKYVVQRGDSFWRISRKVGCTMEDLEQLNGKSRYSMIHPGDVMIVPEG